MKKLSILCAFCFVLSAFSYTSEDLSNANLLADEGIITKQTSVSKYRLDDLILRQEILSIALKMREINLPEKYACKKYFSDVVTTDWTCRTIEIAADNSIISRENFGARPRDYVSYTEAMAIISNAQCLAYRKSDFEDFYGAINTSNAEQEHDNYYDILDASLGTSISNWEKELIAGFQVFVGNIILQKKSSWIHRPMTRREVFSLIQESRMTLSAYMLGCEKQKCMQTGYTSCDDGCVRVCPSQSCVGSTCPSKCSDGFCTKKQACKDFSQEPDFLEWLPGHGIYEPLCDFDCTETNGIKRCQLSVS